MSVHGSNRLGTNSLLDINVFGRRAGMAAAQHAAAVPQPELPTGSESFATELVQALLTSSGTERVATIRRELQTQHGPQRSGVSHRRVARSRPRRTSRLSSSAMRTWPSPTRASASTPTCSRRSNSVSCSTSPRSWSSVLARATESRGGHFREDYPDRDDATFMRHTMAYRRPGRLRAAGLPAGGPDAVPADGAEVLTWRLTRYLRPRRRRERSPSGSGATTPSRTRRRTGSPTTSPPSRPSACSTCCTRSSGRSTAR